MATNNIPQDPKERDKYFLNQIENDNFIHNWREITSTYKNHHATFYMSEKPLMVDNTFITVSAQSQQIIADILNASLPTAKSLDLRHQQCDISIIPLPREITNSTQALIDQTAKINREIKRFFPNVSLENKLISNLGKIWCLSNKLSPTIAMNYGWYNKTVIYSGITCYPSATIPNLYVIQPKSTWHNPQHQDYSQQAIFLRGSVLVDNNLLTLTDVLTDPELSYLISEEGILNKLKQP